MGPRQSRWKWLLAGLLAIAVVAALVLIRPSGPPADIRGKVATSLSEWTGGQATFAGPLTVRYFPPSLEGGLKIAAAEKLPAVQSVSVPTFRLSLSLPRLLAGDVSFSALQLERPTLEYRGDGSDITAEALLGHLMEFLAKAPLETVRIQGGTVRPAGGAPLLSKLNVRINTRGQFGALEAIGSAKFNGETVHFSMDRGTPSETAEGRSAPLTLKITSPPLSARFSGQVELTESLQGQGHLDAKLPDVRHFLTWLGVPLPEGESLKHGRAEGEVHWSGPTLTFDDGTFGFDGNEAVGLLAITAGQRPRIEGTLAFETLLLDPYLPRPGDVHRDAPVFEWVLLKYIDADLRISAAEITAGDLKLGQGGGTINAKKAAISSELGTLEVCGGQAQGRLDLNLSEPRAEASLTGSLDRVALDGCAQSLGLSVPLTGTGTVKADISTGGTSHDEFVRNLAGNITMAVEDGSLPVDLDALLAEPGSKADGWSEDAGTSFSDLKADCSLSAGHVWCQSFRMGTDEGTVSGAGGLDLAKLTLDWGLRMSDPEATPDVTEGAEEALQSITIDGSVSAPSITLVSPPNSQEKPKDEAMDGTKPETGTAAPSMPDTSSP